MMKRTGSTPKLVPLSGLSLGQRFLAPHSGMTGLVRRVTEGGVAVTLDPGNGRTHKEDAVLAPNAQVVALEVIEPEPLKVKKPKPSQEDCGALAKGRYHGLRKPRCWNGKGCGACWLHYYTKNKVAKNG